MKINEIFSSLGSAIYHDAMNKQAQTQRKDAESKKKKPGPMTSDTLADINKKLGNTKKDKKKKEDTNEAYGLTDEPGPGLTKASARQQQSGDPINQAKRANNDNKNANDEANIKAAHDFHSQKRKQYAPTGIPNRAYMQQQQELQNQGKQQ